MPNNQQKEEVKCKCHCHRQNIAHMRVCNRGKCSHCDPIVTSKNEPPEKDVAKPESIVTTLEEDRESIQEWKEDFNKYFTVWPDFRSKGQEKCLQPDLTPREFRDFIEELLAAKERCVRAECAAELKNGGARNWDF